jgi:hypothetical protein
MIDDKDIEKKAHDLWEKAGKPEGRDLEFWEAAKKSFYSLSRENLKNAITIIEGDKNKNQRLGWTITETIGFAVTDTSGIGKIEISYSKNEGKIYDLSESIKKIKDKL